MLGEGVLSLPAKLVLLVWLMAFGLSVGILIVSEWLEKDEDE